MTDWIIKLTGSAVESGSTVVGFDLGTAGGVGAGIIVLIAGPFAKLAAWGAIGYGAWTLWKREK